MLSVTLDIEDHRGAAPGPKRHAAMTEQLLAMLAEAAVKASVFIVADLIATDRALIRRIAAQGHEIGLHSFDHAPLAAHDPEDFRRRTAEARAALADAAGAPVAGYRAPSFSLTRATPWVPEALAEIGFEYSSSVLPAGSPLHGYPGAPREPFRWPCGLLELPAPVGRVGPLTLPYLGGIYFRYLPAALIRRRLRGIDSGPAAGVWSYLHPYDIDPAEPFCRPHGAPLWMSLLLHARRSGARARFARLLRGDMGSAIGPPLGARVAAGHFAAARPFHG